MIRNGVIGVSLVATFGICAVWGISLTSVVRSSATGHHHAVAFTCHYGIVELLYFEQDPAAKGGWLSGPVTVWDEISFRHELWDARMRRQPNPLPPGAFGLTSGWRSDLERAYVRFPLWLPFALFALYPAVAFIRGPLRRWRRSRKGLCVKCGYNLTGLPEPRCPECGAPT
ncbi:MAG: hypothetical protein ACYSVY_28055 [Planctomycetota bacterium]|jgi:hypothetical protein